MRDPDHDRSSPRARNEDRVGTLIRIAGPRPAVPDDREQRVKAAVRDHWRATTRSRTRRTRAIVTLAAAALVILAVGLGILNRSEWMGSSSPAVVERVSGTARARSEAASEGDAFGTVRAGDALPAGTELATEADGRVAIRMASRHSIRLPPIPTLPCRAGLCVSAGTGNCKRSTRSRAACSAAGATDTWGNLARASLISCAT